MGEPDKQPHHCQIIYIKRYRGLTVIQKNKLCPQKHVSRQISCHKDIQAISCGSCAQETKNPSAAPG